MAMHPNVCACQYCLKVIDNYKVWEKSNTTQSEEIVVDNGNGMTLYRYTFIRHPDNELIMNYIVYGLWTMKGEYSIKSIPDLIEFCKTMAMIQ